MRVATCALILTISSTIIGFTLTDAALDNIFCNFGSWANYRPGDGNFKVEDIDPRLCTHILYNFVGIHEDGSLRILDSYLDLDHNGYSRAIALKNINPDLKVILSMGGWNEGSQFYSNTAATQKGRNRMMETVVEFLNIHEFDGMNLVWQYPGMRGGVAADKENFIKLLEVLRQRFDLNEKRLILTATVGVTEKYINSSYDMPQLDKYLDYILLETFDLRGAWDKVTGHTAPMYESTLEQLSYANMNVDAVVKNWIEKGAFKHKLILGISFHGRSFTLSNVTNNAVGAPNSGPGRAGPYTRADGILSYFEICEFLKGGDWTTVWDDQQKVPYSYSGNQSVGYENVRSVKIKCNYAKESGLGGVMVDSIEEDDFRANCGRRYALMNAIQEAYGKPIVPTTTPGYTSLCSHRKRLPYPGNCNKFYKCFENPNGSFVLLEYGCGSDHFFNVTTSVCDYKENVQC